MKGLEPSTFCMAPDQASTLLPLASAGTVSFGELVTPK